MSVFADVRCPHCHTVLRVRVPSPEHDFVDMAWTSHPPEACHAAAQNLNRPEEES